jgi:hypothetical protein
MFCDQDDIWFKNKITLFVRSILEEEKKFTNIPMIIFGDMIIVDENASIINQSFWNHQSLNSIDISNWVSILATNIVTGCSSLLNPRAVTLLRKNDLIRLPLVHDHLAAILTIKSGGKLVKLNEPTMLYRQHGNNVLGASDFNLRYISSKIINLFELHNKYAILYKYFKVNFFIFYYFKIKNNLKRIFMSKSKN